MTISGARPGVRPSTSWKLRPASGEPAGNWTSVTNSRTREPGWTEVTEARTGSSRGPASARKARPAAA